MGLRHRQPPIRHHRHAHRQTYQSSDDDGDEESALHSTGCEHSAQHYGHDTQDSLGGEIAQSHKGVGIGHHDAGVLQSDKGYKHPYSRRNGVAQVARDAVQNLLTHVHKRNEDEDYALYNQCSQRLLPRQVHSLTHGKGKEGIETHTWSLGKRQLGHERKQQGGNGRREGCSCEESALVHTRSGQNCGIDSKDVAHCQKSGSAGHNLRAHTCLGTVKSKGFG